MADTDRESAVAEALAAHEWRERGDGLTSAHRSHTYDGWCAICRGDIPAIVAAVLAALDTPPAHDATAGDGAWDAPAQADVPPSLAEVDHQLTAYLSDPHGSEWRITQAAAVVREIRAAGGESDG